MRIAVMQPYFVPYAGYFRLLQSVDIFVVFDSAQFVRRGWIHRNRLPSFSSEPAWLTLPLIKAPQSTLIKEIGFADDARPRFLSSLKKFPLCRMIASRPDVYDLLLDFDKNVSGYNVALLMHFCRMLGIKIPKILFSSEIEGPIERFETAEERIINIVKKVNGSVYVNASGGRELYSVKKFSENNISIQFLGDYSGDYTSILSRVFNEMPEDILAEIKREC